MLTKMKTDQLQPCLEQPLTKTQAAKWLQVSERTIDRLRAEGRLKCFKHKGMVRFKPEWVNDLLTRSAK